jgi:hypothetical protein
MVCVRADDDGGSHFESCVVGEREGDEKEGR